MNSIIKAIWVLIALLASSIVNANNPTQDEPISVGRYSKVFNSPSAEQLNPLRVVVKTKIPQSIKTVGETIDYLLIRSGYTLLERDRMSMEAQNLLSLNLPAVHRKIGPLTLDVMLKALIGDAFEMVVDPVTRKITFELTSKIRSIS